MGRFLACFTKKTRKKKQVARKKTAEGVNIALPPLGNITEARPPVLFSRRVSRGEEALALCLAS
jgi:hypothetical protein